MESAILDRTINENALRIVDSSTMGRTLVLIIHSTNTSRN